MAKNAGKSVAAIQKLLAERSQIEQWLSRLGLAGDKTPEAVREKVKADYTARLKELVKELASYGDELNDALKRALTSREGLSKQEKEAAERLAEAEVRHAVGEYDEAKWRDVHAEFLGALVRIREELKHADDEIQKLEDAISSMDSGAQAKPAAAPASAFPSTSTSSSIPPTGRKSGAQKQMDELAFLKSVTEDDKDGLKASRASGQQKVPEPIKPRTGEQRAVGGPPAKGPTSGEQRAVTGPPPPPKPQVDVGAAGVAAIDSSGPGKRLTAALEKSLKCKECGTMNLPTEWYCEKCGAELSESL